jgi:predicted nucleic acid-binding protein
VNDLLDTNISIDLIQKRPPQVVAWIAGLKLDEWAAG